MSPPTSQEHSFEPRRPARLAEQWGSDAVSSRYADGRFRSPRAAQRDPRAVRALLSRFARGGPGRVLDVPCGAGRLAAAVTQATESAYVGLDVSSAMLERAREAFPAGRFVRASALALPFAERTFDAVVCCRLLHHLAHEGDLARTVAELVRVSSDLVIASFWDAGSLHAMRRRLGLRETKRDARVAIERGRLAAHFEAAGAPVIAFRHGLRFVTQQTFLAARRS